LHDHRLTDLNSTNANYHMHGEYSAQIYSKCHTDKKTSHVLQLLSTEFDAITFNRRPSCYCRLIVEGFKEI